ncbi:MAG: hypothetical protein ACI4SH_00830 [Candidatus Scatosoma sp.]
MFRSTDDYAFLPLSSERNGVSLSPSSEGISPESVERAERAVLQSSASTINGSQTSHNGFLCFCDPYFNVTSATLAQ